ncbi:hypothetical protein ACVNS2_10555 [Paenibacillus caseinilyticus]|uniref:Uncharacterized protein n=1 Tax=Paenibacillus mucilaginosus K02 TaxID=997761 RepID=I0BFD7_9BACL|nr:hypothetical protein [Paenibacillus mucilaginosus]AFH61084.1 hypothetical protein B2K_10170 [Paenibacillus mucilaginosus K02]AFK65233.1 hypothetical protein [Paenibacillus mucilaginosus K02]
MFKTMIIIAAAIAHIAASGGNTSAPAYEQTDVIDNYTYTQKSYNVSPLVEKLDAIGYYNLVTDEKKAALKQAAVTEQFIYGWEETGRVFFADAEMLAEGFLVEFIEEIDPFLDRQGVKFTQIEDTVKNNGDYVLIVNGEEHLILTDKERREGQDWELATERSFKMINQYLRQNGSKEQIYSLYGGNDLTAVFLTDEMYEAIMSYSDMPEYDKPQEFSP